jgi:hypothetical protein
LGTKQLSYLTEPTAQARTEKAIVPDLHEPLGQDVLQETANELFSSERANLGLVCVGLRVAESNLPLSHVEDPLVTDGHPKDVRS